jgi:signal transduction histidine kinase
LRLKIAGPTTVQGDGDLLREAIANLLDNAIKFTPEGGRVLLACGEPGRLLSVTDSGPGVRAEERAKIIKRFYRSDAAHTVPGVGIGLSMAATIVDLHGLSLDIGDANPGAVFSIVRRPATAPPTARERPRPHRQPRPELVDAGEAP